MIGSRSIKMNSNEEFERLQSSVTDNGSVFPQREQDLQLLIRAHQKIRTLQQENTRLQQQHQHLKYQLQDQKQKSKTMCNENKKLRLQIDELMKRIAMFEKKFDYCQYELVTEGSYETINVNNNNKNDNNNIDINNNNESNQVVVVDSEGKMCTELQGIENENVKDKHIGKLIQKQSDRVLQPSQSTPLIQNTNCDMLSKEQRFQFLSTCKQEFAQQLEKLNERVNSIHRGVSRKGSESLGLEINSNVKSQGYSGVKNFLREAEKQFEAQTLKTLTNNLYVDRHNRMSSGSLIKRDFGKRLDKNDFSKDKLGDRTNYINSKYTSVNKAITTNFDRSSYLTKSPTANSNLRHESAHEHNTPYRDIRQYQQITQGNRQSLLKKCNTSKNLYINNGDNSKYTYCSKDKRAEVKDRKRMEIDMELRDNHGFIKYRGLCL